MEAYEGADWVRVSDEVPIDEEASTGPREVPDALPPGLDRLGLGNSARAGRRRTRRGRGRAGARPRGLAPLPAFALPHVGGRAADAKHEAGGARRTPGEREHRAVDLGHRVPGPGCERCCALVDAVGRPGIRRPVAGRGVQLPPPRDPFEVVLTSIAKLDARSRHQVADRPRNQHLGWLGKSTDLGADANRDAFQIFADHLALPRVDSRFDLVPEVPELSGDCPRAADRTAGPIECGQEPLPAALDRTTREAHKLASRDLIVVLLNGRMHDLGTEHRLGGGALSPARGGQT